MKYIACAIIFLVVACSYEVPKRIQSDFQNRYSGKAELSSLIETEGYYYFSPSVQGLIFYQGGGFVKDNCTDGEEGFKKIIAFRNTGVETYGLHGISGACIISGDTIKCSYVSSPRPRPGSFWAGETWFKVISRTEIEEVYSRQVGKVSRMDQLKYNQAANERIGRRFQFVPTSVKPPFNSEYIWLLGEDWFFTDSTSRAKYGH